MKANKIMPISSDTRLLLNQIYQGCQMGVDSVHLLVEQSKSDHVKKMLLDLASEHRRIMTSAAEELRPYQTAPDSIRILNRLRLQLATIQVRPGQPEKRISKTLTRGARTALRSLMRTLRQYPMATKRSQHLAGELIELEKRTLREGLRLAKALA